ncbi:MAG: MFS transporter [Thermomicrobiales bacterium]
MLETTTAAPQGVGSASIRRFYLYQLVTRTEFTGGIWILYLTSRGFSLSQIGLAESAFHLAPVLLELPSGSFADLIGRRWSLALGALLVAISAALIFVAPSFWVVLVAMFLNGTSYSFRSGADQAYLYDALGEQRSSYTGILGKLIGAGYIVGGATLWLGAALSDISYAWPYGLVVGAGLAGVWLAAGLVEPPRRAIGERRPSAVEHIRDVVHELRQRPRVAAMLAFSGGFWATGTVAYLYLQAAFSDRGMSNSTIGLVIGAALLVSAAGAAIAGRAERVGTFRRQVVILGLLSGLGVAGLAVGSIWLATAAYLASNVVIGLLEPLMYAWFNRQMPSEQRATLLSAESWLFSLTMIVIFPLSGWLAERAGWNVLFLLCGGVMVLLTLIVAVAARAATGRSSDVT